MSRLGRLGIASRLLAEDWHEMAAPAYTSPRHVGNLDRWRKLAEEKNPALNEEQRDRLAVLLRSQYFSDLRRKRTLRDATAKAA